MALGALECRVAVDLPVPSDHWQGTRLQVYVRVPYLVDYIVSGLRYCGTENIASTVRSQVL